MDDILRCPICNNKLRTNHLENKLLYSLGKTSNYYQRICTKGYNHYFVIYSDKITKKVDLLKLSLNPQYSRFIEINFLNKNCRLTCLKENEPYYIDIDKLIIPDFPDLVKIKEIIGLYIAFS